MAVANQTKVDGLINIGGRKLKGNEFVAAVEGTLVKNITDAMEKLGISVVYNLAKYAPADSGKLASSFSVIGVKETKSGYRLEISVGAEYSDYQDKGVKGIRNRRKTFPNAEGRFYQFKTYGMPVEALQNLEGWMKRKNMEIEATNLIEGRQMLPQISSSAKRLAYFIKKYGIQGRQFIKQSINESTPQFNLDIKSIGSDSLVLKISK